MSQSQNINLNFNSDSSSDGSKIDSNMIKMIIKSILLKYSLKDQTSEDLELYDRISEGYVAEYNSHPELSNDERRKLANNKMMEMIKNHQDLELNNKANT